MAGNFKKSHINAPHSSKAGNDPTDALSKAGRVVMFTHVPTGKKVAFKAFVTQFEDRYEVQWNPNSDVYGRMDPVATYKRTERNITMGFDIPAASSYDAWKNLQRLSQLIRFLYPVYTNAAGTGNRTIKAAPLLKLKFMNLARDAQNVSAGLVGMINGISMSPDVETGFFDGNDGTIVGPMASDTITGLLFDSPAGTQGALAFAQPSIYPKVMKVQFQFKVLHTHELGFSDDWKEIPYKGSVSQINTPTAITTDGPGIQFPYATDRRNYDPSDSTSTGDLGVNVDNPIMQASRDAITAGANYVGGHVQDAASSAVSGIKGMFD